MTLTTPLSSPPKKKRLIYLLKIIKCHAWRYVDPICLICKWGEKKSSILPFFFSEIILIWCHWSLFYFNLLHRLHQSGSISFSLKPLTFCFFFKDIKANMQQCQIHEELFAFSASINFSYRLKVISRGCVWIELLKFRLFVGLCIIHLCLRVILLFPFVFSLNALQIFTTLEPRKQNKKTWLLSLDFFFFFPHPACSLISVFRTS